MKTQSDLHLYLLKKVHGWCKRQGMTDPPKCISFNRRMHLILQRRTLPTKEQKMKQEESRELRNLSMNQLNAKLSELYKELQRRNPKYSFERPYRNHLLRQINQNKYEQPLRRKGLRSQGVFITLNK